MAIVVELAPSSNIRQGGGLVWTFDRDIVPFHRRGVSKELWHWTCDRFRSKYRAIARRRVTIAHHHAVLSTLWMYPVVIFLCTVLVYCYTHRFEERGKFVWLAWLATDLAVAACTLVDWLVARCYVIPALMRLDDEWKNLATSLQGEYEWFGVDVEVKRVPAVQPLFAKLLPDGLLSCGLVLEQVSDKDQFRQDADDDIEEEVGATMPKALTLAGVPVATWAITLRECQSLEAGHAGRIETVLRSTLDDTQRSCFYLGVAFVAAPLLAWAFGFTANYCVVYVVSLMVYGTCAQSILHLLVAEAKVRAAFQHCHDGWRALARQTETSYARYNVVVTVQTRDVPFLFHTEDVTIITSVFRAGHINRAVGLSFRTGVNVSIEYGKVATEEQPNRHADVSAFPVATADGPDLV
jgi:hypothetical protein